MFDELCESHPTGRVHVQVMLVLDVLLIHIVGFDTFCTEPNTEGSFMNYASQVVLLDDPPSRQQCHKLRLELCREVADMLPRVFANDKHLS
jgi:hypothetical protein